MISPEALSLAIARCWSSIKATLSDNDWRSFSGRLLTPLRQLDDQTLAAAPIISSIQALFGEYPTAAIMLAAAVGNIEPQETRDAPSGRPSLDSPFFRRLRPPSRHVLIDVLFGTDREVTSAAGEVPKYSSYIGKHLSFGSATVSLPDDHRKGALERPRWYRLEFREDPSNHVMITSLTSLTESEFVQHAGGLGGIDGSENDALIFVHGYNVSFDDCVRRTAQFAVDLEFRGVPIAYSWPSAGQLASYAADANASEASMFALADFISLVRSRLGLRRVHVVAHSMGSRLVARALNQNALKVQLAPLAPLRHVIFAAPDIDPKTFSGFAKEFTRDCSRCTLYASSHDMALAASRIIYRSARAGTADDETLIHGVDSIDASLVDQSLIGHSYFVEQRSVLADLHELLDRDAEPACRFGLEEVTVPDGRYWRFKA